MVNDANVRRLTAEKALKESIMKVEVLTAEVTALKTLVLSLTPNKPSFLSQLQVDSKMKDCAPSPTSEYLTANKLNFHFCNKKTPLAF